MDEFTEPAASTRDEAHGGLNATPESPASSGAASARSTASQGLPSRRQLLHLLDRAERRVLLPTEAALLRRSVEALLDAPALRAEQRAELGRLRVELVETRRQAAADQAQLARVLAQAGDVSPTLVACPSCGAAAGQRCRPKRGRRTGLYVEHAPRRRAVGRLVFAEALAEAGGA